MQKAFDNTPEERATVSAFFKRQFFRSSPVVTRDEVDLAGKTAIVTGSNSGIGFQCSQQLLDLGVTKLIMAVRSVTKGEAARLQLKTIPGKQQTIEVWDLDLADYDSIQKFTERTKTLGRLDIVVHNAGMTNAVFRLNTKTGHEEIFQTNYLSLVLLTILLLPVLKEKNPDRPGRLVLVSSETSAWAAFEERNSTPILPAFDKQENFNTDRYFCSRLLGQLFLMELSKRVPSSVAVVNASNPGLCYGSNFSRDLGGILAFINGVLYRLIGRSTALGARALTDAAVRHGEESHGQYIEDGKLQPMAPLFYKPEGERLAKQLWEETMEELSFARLAAIVEELIVV